MKTFDLRHLRQFVAVAEELHFGRAAERLGIAQPPLSQAIQRLESALGVALFERVKRSIKLTPAGKVLLEEGRQILVRADLTAQLVRRTAAGEIARLRIGCMPWSLLPALPHAIRNFRGHWPDHHSGRAPKHAAGKGATISQRRWALHRRNYW